MPPSNGSMNAMNSDNSAAVFEDGKYTLQGRPSDEDLDGSATEFHEARPKTQYQIVADAMRKKEGDSDKPAPVKYLKKVGASLLSSSSHGRRSLGLMSLSGHLRRSVSAESAVEKEDEEGLISDFQEDETEEQKLQLIETIRRSRTMGVVSSHKRAGSTQKYETASIHGSSNGEDTSNETIQAVSGDEDGDMDEDVPKKQPSLRKGSFHVRSLRPPPATRGVGRTRSFENPFNAKGLRPPLNRKVGRSRSFGDGQSLHRRTSVSDSVNRALGEEEATTKSEKPAEKPAGSSDDSTRASTRSAPVNRPSLGTFFKRQSSRKLKSGEDGAAKSVTSAKSDFGGLSKPKTKEPETESLPRPSETNIVKSVLKNTLPLNSDSSAGGSHTSYSSCDSSESDNSDAESFLKDLNEIAGMMSHDLSLFIQQKEEEMEAGRNMSFPRLSLDDDDSESVESAHESTVTAPLSTENATKDPLQDSHSSIESTGSEDQGFSQLVIGTEGDMKVEKVVSQSVYRKPSKKKKKSKKSKDSKKESDGEASQKTDKKSKKERRSSAKSSSSKDKNVKEKDPGDSEKPKRRRSVEKKDSLSKSQHSKTKSIRRTRSIDVKPSDDKSSRKSRSLEKLEKIPVVKPLPSLTRCRSVEEKDLNKSSHSRRSNRSRSVGDKEPSKSSHSRRSSRTRDHPNKSLSSSLHSATVASRRHRRTIDSELGPSVHRRRSFNDSLGSIEDATRSTTPSRRSTTPSRRRRQSPDGMDREDSDKSLHSQGSPSRRSRRSLQGSRQDSDKSLQSQGTPSRRRQRSIDRLKRSDSSRSMRSSERRLKGLEQVKNENSEKSLGSVEGGIPMTTSEDSDGEIDALKSLLEEKGLAIVDLTNMIEEKEKERNSFGDIGQLVSDTDDGLEKTEDEKDERGKTLLSPEAPKSREESGDDDDDDSTDKADAEAETIKRAGKKIKYVGRASGEKAAAFVW